MNSQTQVAAAPPHAEHAGIGAANLLDVLRGMLRHRKKLIIISTLLFAALGLLVIMLSSPTYTAASQVLIEYEETPYTRAGMGNAPAATRQITERDVRSQVEVIRSHDLALKVLRKLGLIGTPEFDPLKKGFGPLSRLKVMLGFAPDPRRQTPEQRALAVWEKRLKAYNLPNTKVIVIEFNSSSPRTAAAVANALAEAYVEQTRSTRLARTGEAREWLKEQIEKLRRKVVQAEKAVESYRARAGLFQGVRARLHNQELSELSAQIVRAAAERSQAEAKARAIRKLLKRGEVEKSADVLRSRLIQRLREQQVQIRRRLAELTTTYLDNHPKVRAVRRELADLKRQINAEARKIAESLEEQARIAAAREAELRARQAKMKAQVSAASLSEVKLRELEREAKAQRSLLESFLARYTDALTREDKQALPGMARVITRAWPPASPSFPKPGPIMLLSTLAGLVLGAGLAFILEVMAAVRRAEAETTVAASPAEADRRQATPAPRTAVNVEDGAVAPGQHESMPSSGHVSPRPEVVSVPAAQAAANSGATAASDDDSLRAMAVELARQLRLWHENENIQQVGITSLGLHPRQDVAATLATARDLARDHRVILLDVARDDYCLPGASGTDGLAEMLSGKAGFSAIVRADDAQPRLHMVASGRAPLAAELLEGEVMRRLMDALRDNYDFILMHEGLPRFPLEQSESILPRADAVALMHAAHEEELAAGLREALRQAGVRHVITVSPGAGRIVGEVADTSAHGANDAAAGQA